MFNFRNDRHNQRPDEQRPRRDALDASARERQLLANQRVLRRIVDDAAAAGRHPSHYRIRVRRTAN